MKKSDFILFSGGAPGAEAEFGACAERHGIEEVNFTFDGHTIARRRGVRVLNHEELQAGDVSLEYVSRLMHRRYTDSPLIRKVLQTLWYQVNNGQEIYVVGVIQDDDTVRGGTGWGAEFAKLCNKPLFVFDQEKDGWFEWSGEALEAAARTRRSSRTRTSPARARATSRTTRRRAIEDLITKSFEIDRLGPRRRASRIGVERSLAIGVDRFDRAVGPVLQLGDLDVAQVGLPPRQLRVVVEEVPLPLELDDRVVIGPAEHRLEDLAAHGERAVRRACRWRT